MKAVPLSESISPVYSRASAAVAVIRCLKPVESILLLRRIRSSKDPWSGHFAFPGGRRDAGDNNAFETCLREVYEESGISLRDDSLQKILPLTPAGRNVAAPVMVQPFLFELPSRPPITIETREIESFIWLESAAFKDRNRHEMVEILPNRIRPAFPLTDYYVWGFTYGILCRLLEVTIDW